MKSSGGGRSGANVRLCFLGGERNVTSSRHDVLSCVAALSGRNIDAVSVPNQINIGAGSVPNQIYWRQ